MSNQAEQQYFQFGGLVSPVTSATTNPLLQDADPALWAILGFYQGLLQIHLSARWDAEMAKAGLTQFVGQCGARAVACDPIPFLTQAQITPPFLAVFPASEERDERTRNWIQSNGKLKAMWVLPPFTIDQHLALSPFLRAAGKVFMDRTEIGYDPSYQTGTPVCVTGVLDSFDVKKVSYGNVPTAGDLFFPTLELEIDIVEIKQACASPPATRSPLTGTDVTISTTDPTGTENFITPGVNFQ